MRVRALLAAPVAALAIVLAGCDTLALPSGGPSGAATVRPTATETATAPDTFGPTPLETHDDATPVVIDSSLLELLPAMIGSAPVQEDADAAAEAVNDPALSEIATGVDAGAAVDIGNGDLAYALVVRLKAGALDDELYRQWRDSYDAGACTQSGGVAGHAQAEFSGRQTYVTTCVQGLRTYHLWLVDESVLISASSIGDGRFGEELLKGLRLPG